MQKTAIIVPCYNESQRLKASEFLNYLERNNRVSFIFVNDGSIDNTLEIINQICLAAPDQALCINLLENGGKAEAVRQGFLKAFEFDFEKIGYWDADLSTPLYFINRLSQRLEDDKIITVMGSRVRLLGYNIRRQTVRHYLGRVFATFASLVLGLPVYDTQCGAKIFKNSSELKKIFAYPFSVRWIFDVEILARYKIIIKISGARALENSALEYPLEHWTDIRGSKLKFIDFLVGAIELAKIYLLLKFPRIKSQYANRFRD